jgi:hypothetical protein
MCTRFLPCKLTNPLSAVVVLCWPRRLKMQYPPIPSNFMLCMSHIQGVVPLTHACTFL